VNFQISEDQRALQEGVRSFCEGRLPDERLAELAEGGGFDRALWKDLAELGVFSLRRAQAEGGLGLGFCESVLVFAELGRRAAPGPLAWSQLAVSLIDGVAEGEVVVGGLDLTDGAALGPHLLEHLDHVDVLLVMDDAGLRRLDPNAIEARPVEVPLDPLTPLHRADSLPEGEWLAGPDEAARLRIEGAALLSGQLLGIAETTLLMAVAFAKEREQFGRLIGGFQALKHLMADMFVRQEVARSAVYAAGATLDDPLVGSAPRAVSAAKLVASEAALANAHACIQIHGGMGFTWEVPAHYFLKRARVLECCFGGSSEHADESARHLAERAEALVAARA
jgi:alkylation response protein AidB-like acyl-CoA dehydrogenase